MPQPNRLFQFFSLLALVCSATLLGSCQEGTSDLPLDEIEINFKVHRLDLEMLEAAKAWQQPGADSAQIYQQLFADDRAFLTEWMFYGNDSLATDSILTILTQEFLSDSNALGLLTDIEARYPDAPHQMFLELENFFKRYHYHFPQNPIPVAVTFADGFPASIQQGLEQFFITPRHLGIGIHYLMGDSYPFYPPDFPKYLRRRCNPEHFTAQIAHRYADAMIPEPRLEDNPVLIDHIVHQGLQMYFVQQLISPATPDSILLFYTQSQMNWANTYEARAYKDLVGSFYEINFEMIRRYIDDSPFTSQLNRESAPRLGQYIGWKMIQKYTKKHTEESLEELIQRTDYQKIFKSSGYRPNQN